MSAEASNAHDKPPTRFSWLKPKQSEKLDSASVSDTEKEKRTSSVLRVSTPVEDTPKPISVAGLFRYCLIVPFIPSYCFLTISVPSFSTRLELILNAIGLVAAAAAGAAQVCLEIPFLISSADPPPS